MRSGLPLRALCQDGEQVGHRRVPVFLNQAGDGEAPATPAGPANHDHVGRAHVGNWQPLGTKSLVPASGLWGRFYAAVSRAALDFRPDLRFAVWPSPLFFASADRVAAYSGATIG